MAFMRKTIRPSLLVFNVFKPASKSEFQKPLAYCFHSLCANNLTENVPQTSIKFSFRCYAKGKDRKKDGKNKHSTVNLNQLSQIINVQDLTNQLDNTINKMKEDFVKHFTLRTSLSVLDTLEIEFEGTDYTLQDLAQIGRKNANLYVVDLSSFPQVIPIVLKAISASGLGLNPQQDGTTLFIPVPKVTKEHRETLSKNAKAVFVKTKDELRNVQNKFIKSLSRKEGLSEDNAFFAKEQITIITDQHIATAEALLKAKQDELKG